MTESKVVISGLSVVPELHTDMSFDCLIGYIAMDSIARSENTNFVLLSPLNAKLNELRFMTRWMYSIMDYNPTLFRRHIISTRDSLPDVGGRYKSFLANVYYGTENAVKKRLNEFGKDYALLILSSYIMKVRVTDVRIGLDTTYTREASPYVNVACEVLETFKGQYKPDNCFFPQMTKRRKEIATTTCFKYGHPLNWPTDVTIIEGDRMTSGGEIRTEATDEVYYVFLLHCAIGTQEWVENVDVILPLNYLEKAGGLFRVVNGNVEDPSNLFGGGVLPTEAKFRELLMNKINDVKGWKAP